MSIVLTFITILSIITFSPSAASAAELADDVCKNTTNYSFCHEVVYIDERAPTAEQYVLNYIAFGVTYKNASNTRNFIESKLKEIHKLKPSNSKISTIYAALRVCMGYYEKAVQSLVEAWGNLDSESFDRLDLLALDVDRSARQCEASIGGNRNSMSKRNRDLIKLANICLVVAKLYDYS